MQKFVVTSVATREQTEQFGVIGDPNISEDEMIHSKYKKIKFFANNTDYHSWLLSQVLDESISNMAKCVFISTEKIKTEVPLFMIRCAWPFLDDLIRGAPDSFCNESLNISFPDESYEILEEIKAIITSGSMSNFSMVKEVENFMKVYELSASLEKALVEDDYKINDSNEDLRFQNNVDNVMFARPQIQVLTCSHLDVKKLCTNTCINRCNETVQAWPTTVIAEFKEIFKSEKRGM